VAAPTYTVEIGWANAIAGTFRIGVSAIGSTDVLANQFTTFFDGPYDDITEDVERIRIRRGRDNLLDAMQAGSCEIIVRRPTDIAYWNPLDLTNDINSQLPGFVPMRPVRVSATYSGTTYRLFYGFLRSARHDPQEGITQLQAVNLFLWLSRTYPITATNYTDPVPANEGDAETIEEADVVETAGRSRSGILATI
jgi:hypothetical protein